MLDNLHTRLINKHVLILGVGNTMRGDDGLGSILIERLQGKVNATLVDGSDVPENYLGVIEAAHPQAIVIVDAANLGA